MPVVALTSPRGIAMKGYLPPFYESSVVLDAFCQAEGAEFDLLREALLDGLGQFFVVSADWTLGRWEAELGIPSTIGATDADRRQRLLARIRGYGTATLGVIEAVVKAFGVNDLDVVEDHLAYAVTILYHDPRGIPARDADIQAAVREVLPAHLTFTVEYRYLTWDELDCWRWDWDALDALDLTWDELEAHDADPDCAPSLPRTGAG